ncbi:HDOD domain-containing protein [Bythopirellula goksoeyrii]|uniref:HDOD domain protein n=1 Tax=Bythopirellula goksoeyrii TaxID=1400387 RepID=A0A5B9QFE6_9BACT|nr:HDOD domain-containing protein [Bythopirellula goksoeyrii]QEG37777.1 HDOD domain protein [Bythopirellula goksoeyrii]
MTDTLIASNFETTAPTIDQFVGRVKSLYSLPVVAAEVLELTACPQVDTSALKACIERDPALTVRILRVVNSSLFGLSHPVSNLSQAITMLGIKPLKLLVLGFSLPEGLFANVAREQLEWYWSTTLVRAVAAREISEQLFERPGDEAFLAGLLQDIGVLALLGQFQESYSCFLASAIESEANLEELETESLGFDHLELSAALLEQWNMPAPLGRAIANVRTREFHAGGETSSDHLTRVLQLATLLGELVGRHRLSSLPDLLTLGAKYCGLDKSRLCELVSDLQPRVEQLAEVLALRLPDGREYSEILIAAHGQMSAIAIEDPLPSISASERTGDVLSQVHAESARLRFAVQAFLQGPSAKAGQSAPTIDVATSSQTRTHDHSFERRLVVALGKCRAQRQPLSVVMLEIALDNRSDKQHQSILSEILDTVCREEFCCPLEIQECTPFRRTLILPGCDRQEAVHTARGALQAIETAIEQQNALDRREQIHVSAGVASAALPSRNFDASRLLQAANRCLAGARTCGTNSVKSLEIY